MDFEIEILQTLEKERQQKIEQKEDDAGKALIGKRLQEKRKLKDEMIKKYKAFYEEKQSHSPAQADQQIMKDKAEKVAIGDTAQFDLFNQTYLVL